MREDQMLPATRWGTIALTSEGGVGDMVNAALSIAFRKREAVNEEDINDAEA